MLYNNSYCLGGFYRQNTAKDEDIIMSTQKNTSNTKAKGTGKIKVILISILVIALVAGSFVVNSDYFYTSRTAVTIGDTEYTAAEVNYFYTTAYNNFYDSMGDYASYIIDSSLPLDEQYYADDMSFHDYFLSSAFSTMTWMTALCDEANANGFTLSAETTQSITDEFAMLDIYASMYSMTTDQYITSIYGKGVDSNTLTEMLSSAMLASEYSASISESFTYTSDELAANYAENSDSYDNFEYRVYYIENGEDAEAAYAAADKIATAADGDEFAELVLAHATEAGTDGFTENEATLYEASGSTLDSYDYGTWLKDASRSEFEATSIESSSGDGYYVVMFIGRSSNDYKTQNVRHILINAVADENGEYTDEAKADALATAESILAEFKAGNTTEDSFAELANTYSEDTGSNTVGGLYENIALGQTVTAFEDFCFADHASGDVEIVYNEGYYTGYHIIYYVGEGDMYCDVLAESSLRSTDYSEWETALSSNYDVTEFYTVRFVG